MKKIKTKWLLLALICILGIIIAVLIVNQSSKKNKTVKNSGNNQRQELVASGEMKDGELLDYEALGMLEMGEYKGLAVNVTPTETDVYESILAEAEKYKYEERVKKGDWISLDYEGFINGQSMEELTENSAAIKVGAGHLFTPAFERALLGFKIGSEYTFDISFAEDYFDTDVAGQDVTFSVTVNAKFNDVYAKKMSKGKYKTVEAYYEQAKVEEEKGNRNNAGETAWDDYATGCKVKKYPGGSRKQAYKDQKRSYKWFAKEGGLTYEEFIGQMQCTDADVHSLADDNVRDRMIAKTIAKKENLTLTDEEYERLLLLDLAPSEDEDKTLKAMEKRFKEERSCYPRDDMLIEYVKAFIGKHAKMK